MPAGEAAKQRAVAGRLGCGREGEREGTVVALGGGTTTDLAAFAPDRGGEVLFPALAASERGSAEFFGVLAGLVSPRDFFRPGNLRRLLGWRGLGQLVRAGRPPRVRLT